MKRWLAAALLLSLLPALAAAEIEVKGETQSDGENQIVLFAAEAAQTETAMTQEEQLAQETLLLMVNGALEMRFAQNKAQELYDRGQEIFQSAHGYSDGSIASLALVWRGVQPDGGEGSRPYSLTLDLQTGGEIETLDALFSDPDAAVAAMEAIIERDYLEDMNTYIEVADLLPMPRDCFSVDETGLTVYYDDSRFCTFEGSSGWVTFYWHEIAAFIGEDSPVYALSRPQEADAQAIRNAQGYFGEHRLLGLHEPLGKAMDAYGLTDEPDYTTNSILYPVDDSKIRGYSVEIPKYAETDDADTPICAVRHTRVSWHGLTTGTTTREETVQLLGEPEKTVLYDGDDALDMMLDPGESLFYTCENFVLEAHMDEDGVLACLILRDAMPEMLYGI